MVAGALLPTTIHKGKLYFLFGKENPLEDSSKGWSDFGGGCEKDETPFETALREGSEELTGFLGFSKELKNKIKKNGGVYPIQHGDYHTHIFYLPYDENLPIYFNENHNFLWKKMDKYMLNKSKLFEKIEINWFSQTDLTRRKKEFRHFYQQNIETIKQHFPQIKKFIFAKMNKGRKTQKTTNKKSKKTQKDAKK